MKILITGGSGFLGTQLSMALLNLGHDIIWVSQNPNKITPPKLIHVIDYDTLKSFNQSVDIIINLAGSGITDKHWTDDRKLELLNSRIMPTQAILNYLNHIYDNPKITKPQLLITGSAIGYYGTANHDIIFDENSTPKNTDFASQLCQAWEKLALTANIKNIAVIRTGVVLDNHGGMLKRLLPAFKFGLGGRLGNGNQTLSWISVYDWVNAVIFIIDKNTNIDLKQRLPRQQFYNLTNPNPMTNHEFTSSLGRLLKRPTICHLPSWFIRLVFGEMSILLIDGQNVYPKHLLELGFVFNDNTLDFLKG